MTNDALLVLALLAAAVFAVLYVMARLNVQADAKRQYEAWREAELARIVAEQRGVAKREALADLDLWRGEAAAEIRHDAIERSRTTILGRVTEQLTPWHPAFPYNPKDARFIGSPIDMIVFDGCDDDDVRRIVFLEIKTNSSALSSRQRQIRDAIKAGRVEWQELRIRGLQPHG